jgi:hypothetical protein
MRATKLYSPLDSYIKQKLREYSVLTTITRQQRTYNLAVTTILLQLFVQEKGFSRQD